jgi:3-hydroxyacyl-[acyl-carrier-protein] dehydratase
MRSWHRRDLRVPEEHATASGHFPGRPIIPGALLLDEVVGAIATRSPFSFRMVKFLAPLRHGEAFELHWHDPDDGTIRFEIRRPAQDRAVLTGVLEMAG